MSKLGTVPRKSLVARFDAENIVKVATSPDDQERLWVTVPDEDGKEFIRPFSVNTDSLDYPLMELKVTNQSGAEINYGYDHYLLGEYGIAENDVSISNGETATVKTLFELLDPLDNPLNPFKGRYVARVTPFESTVIEKISSQNCWINPIHSLIPIQDGYVVIVDPTANAYAEIVVRSL